MSRLFAVTSKTDLLPIVALETLDNMREGQYISDIVLFLSDFGGSFDDIKDASILSGVFLKKALTILIYS